MASPQRFVLLRDSTAEPSVKAGATVYALALSDYGCAATDTLALGLCAARPAAEATPASV